MNSDIESLTYALEYMRDTIAEAIDNAFMTLIENGVSEGIAINLVDLLSDAEYYIDINGEEYPL